MDQSTFERLCRRAQALRRIATDPHHAEWLVGYVRGLRRAYHGEQFGAQAEHEALMATDTPLRASLAKGYKAGLEGKPCYPPGFLDEPDFRGGERAADALTH